MSSRKQQIIFCAIPWRKALLFMLVLLIGVTVFSTSNRSPVAHAATSSYLNFQARLMTNTGSIVPDGFYNVQFKLYDAASAGTNLWTESYYDTNGVTAGNDFRVQVVNGYLTANLGSQTAFPAINWDQPLWITLNIGGTTQTASPTYDGEMTPRLQLTAVPYAFKAGQLAKTTGANVSTLDFATQTGARSLLLPDESGTLCIQTSANCGFALSSGSGSYIQNGTSPQTASFNVTGTGVIGTSLTTPILQSAAATTLLVDSGTTGALNIGTGANAKTIAIGNVTGATALNERVGTGNYTLDGVAASTYNLGASTTTGSFTLGGTAQTGNIVLGSSSGTNSVLIGNGAGATTVNISNANAAGAVNIGTAFTTGTISIGGTGLQTGTISLGTGTGVQAINLATGGTGAKTVTLGSTASTSSLLLQAGTGNLTLTTLGTGTLGVGNNAVAQTIAIGNVTGATALNERVGTGNYTLDGVAASTYNLGASTTTGSFTLGGTAQTGNIVLGSSSGTNSVLIGNGAGATTVNISNANAAGAVNIGTAFTTGTISIGGTGLQTGTISLGTGTGVQAINLATGGTGAKTVTLGSTASTSTTTIQAGTGGINIGTGGIANTVQIGTITGAVIQNINLGTNATASSTSNVAIGSTVAGTTTIQNVATISLNAPAINSNAATVALFASPTTINEGAAAATFNIGPTGATATSINLAGGSAATGCTVDGATGNLTCSGNINGAATGTAGYWTRAGTTLSPATAGDNISTTGTITSGLINGQTISSAANFTGTVGVAGTTTLAGNLVANGNTNIGDAGTDRLSVTAQIQGGSPLVFQGATDNAFTTTFAITDPTANQTVTFRDGSGTVCLENSVNCGFATTSGSGSYIQNQNASPQASANFNISGGGTIGTNLTVSGGGEDITLNGPTSNYINFGTTGVGVPTFTTRSVGTKIVLYSQVGVSSSDYAIGIAGGALWNSASTTAGAFTWYGGTSLAASLSGTGNLTLGPSSTGTITSGLINSQTISSAANLTGSLNVATTLSLGGNLSLANVSNVYTEIVDGSGTAATAYFGSATDPTNYYDNTQHVFRARGGGSIFATINSGGLTLNGTTIAGVGALAVQSAATTALTLSSGTTGILTVDSGTTGAINIGTGANAKAITIGNSTGVTAISLQGGTGSGFISLSGTLTDTAAAAVPGINNTVTINPASASATDFRALNMTALIPGTNSQTLSGSVEGGFFETRYQGTGSAALLVGSRSQVVIPVAGSSFGTITNAVGSQVAGLTEFASGAITGTVTNATGLQVLASSATHITLQNTIGVDILAQTAGTLSDIGLRIAKADTYTLQLSDTGGTASGGVTFGTDANLYRRATDTLMTDDSLIVQGNGVGNALLAGTTAYSTGTIAQTTTAITGTGTTFTAAMVGGTIIYNDGTTAIITAFTDATHITSSVSKTVTAGASYSIQYGGFAVSATGTITARNTANSTTAFQVQNATGTTLLGIDTTNSRIFSNVASGGTAFALKAVNISGSGILLSVQDASSAKFEVDYAGRITKGLTPAVRVYNSTNQTYTAAGKALTFDTDTGGGRYNNDGLFNSGASTSRFTIPSSAQAGMYTITAGLFSTTVSNCTIRVTPVATGTPVYISFTQNINGFCSLSANYQFVSGDFVEFYVASSAGTATASSVPDYSPTFSMTRIGP